MKQNYTQCLLVYDQTKISCRWEVAWIPSQFAVKGKSIRIKNWGDKVDEWIVYEVYGTAPAERIEKHERDYLEFHVE